MQILPSERMIDIATIGCGYGQGSFAIDDITASITISGGYNSEKYYEQIGDNALCNHTY